MGEEQTLLVKNKIKIVETGEGLSDKKNMSSEIADLPIQKSNKKFLGLFRLKLWFYMRTEGKKLTKFRNWIRTGVGEPPVIYDEEKTQQTVNKMDAYLANKGHFFAEITTDVVTKPKKRRTIVTYNIYPKGFYRIGEIHLPDGNSKIDQLIQSTTDKQLINSGDPFDAKKLDNERTRITNLLREEGFFFFGNEFISFDLDSTEEDMEIDVYYRINQPSDSSFHSVYFIDSVIVFPEYSMKEFINSQSYLDTIGLDNYNFIQNEGKVRPRVIRDHIFFEKDEIYRQNNFRYSLLNLNSLGAYKYVNIEFQAKKKEGLNFLDAYVYMIPAKKQGFSVDLEGSNNFQGLLGLRVGFGYWNRNLSHKADLLNVNLSTGVELQFGQSNILNTADANLGISYRINKILAGKKIAYRARKKQPKTVFGVNFTFQRRIEFYTLNSATFSFGYDWTSKKNMRHLFNPFTFSQVFVYNKTEKFEERLESNPSLRNAFEEQFIIGLDYTYLYNNSYKTKRPRSTMFFRGQGDIAGNVLHGLVSLTKINKPNAQKPYELFGRVYSQFVRLEADIRNYFKINKNLELVTRFNAGIGIAYGNTTTLPYVKQFFVGGTNGLRGFTFRGVGPGGLVDSTLLEDDAIVDQTGDIKIEINAELRFGIYKWIKGAIFADAGNVWLLRTDPLREDGEFNIGRFYKEIAMDMGLGLRLDFTYFVLRFDWGMAFHNPNLPKGDRWVIKNFDMGNKQWRQDNIRFNLGIGYPF